MSRNQPSYTPTRTTTTIGGRRCDQCNKPDLYCECSDEYHRAEARRILGGRIPTEESNDGNE